MLARSSRLCRRGERARALPAFWTRTTHEISHASRSPALAAAALAGCHHTGDIVVEEGVGITALRTVCPAVGIPDYTGDVTLFNPPDRAAPPTRST